jgi:molybdenum cofactor cytidylyltransferase
MNTAIVILAAGKSSRLGQPKQMLEIEGKTLIKRATEMAINTKCYPICVVVGANKPLVVPELVDMPITLIDNKDYEKGMSSSIKMGLIGVYLTQKDIDAVIFMTCDMPFVNENVIEKLIEKSIQFPDSQVVACKYDNQIGIPVLFKRSLFSELLDLSGEEGAKQLILQNKDKTTFIDFPEGKYDIDTKEDYQTFLNLKFLKS